MIWVLVFFTGNKSPPPSPWRHASWRSWPGRRRWRRPFTIQKSDNILFSRPIKRKQFTLPRPLFLAEYPGFRGGKVFKKPFLHFQVRTMSPSCPKSWSPCICLFGSGSNYPFFCHISFFFKKTTLFAWLIFANFTNPPTSCPSPLGTGEPAGNLHRINIF